MRASAQKVSFEQIIFAGTEIIEEFPTQRGRLGHRKSNGCAARTGAIMPRRPSSKSQLLRRLWNRARVASIGREAIILWGLTGRRSRRVRRFRCITIGRMAWLARRRRRRIHIDAFAINWGRVLRGEMLPLTTNVPAREILPSSEHSMKSTWMNNAVVGTQVPDVLGAYVNLLHFHWGCGTLRIERCCS
jgi:hypothetical protein